MPFNLPVFNQGSDAPEVADGLALLRFEGVDPREHDDWAGTDKFGKEDDGVRLHWSFTLMSSDGAVVYSPDGDPIELDALTRRATGERSGAYALFSGIATPVELAAYKAGTLTAEMAQGMIGRLVNGKIAHSKKGWPQVEQIIGIAAARTKKTKAELKAEAEALLAAAEAEDGE